jgi:hypothetical protein
MYNRAEPIAFTELKQPPPKLPELRPAGPRVTVVTKVNKDQQGISEHEAMNTYVQAVTPAKRKAQRGIIKQIKEVAPDPNLKCPQVLEKMVGAIDSNL